MRKSDIFLIIWLFLSPPAFAAEKVEITTYYPSPNGVAKQLLLAPTTSDPAPAFDEGVIYYNDTQDALLLCNGTACPVWQGMSGPTTEYWKENTTVGGLYPNTTTWLVSTVNGTGAVNGTLEIGLAFFKYNAATTQFDGINLSSQVNLGLYDISTSAYSRTRAFGTVSGGFNYMSAPGGTVVGGRNNSVSSQEGVIVGGRDNACFNALREVVSSGWNNKGSIDNAHARSYTVVSGGLDNTAGGLTAGNYAVVSSGYNNTASGEFSVISGGESNVAGGNYSTVSGGQNCSATGNFSTVSGGELNVASGNYSAVTSGYNNTASGDYSWAGGKYATANGAGSFVWNGLPGTPLSANGAGTFNIVVPGGIYFTAGAGPYPDQVKTRIFDVAEHLDIPGNSSLSAGELVSLTSDRAVDKSMQAYDRRLLGVVTGNRTCSFFMGESRSPRPGYRRAPVSLAGPVYCRVNDQSGPIAIGDPVTSSATAGEGMKARQRGRIVGYAMQDEKFQDARSKEIIVFVSPGYYQRAEDFSRMDEEIAGLEKRIEKLEMNTGKAR